MLYFLLYACAVLPPPLLLPVLLSLRAAATVRISALTGS